MNIKTKVFIGFISIILLYQGSKWGYGQAAQAYFDYKCENHAGEFIYRTVDNVEGLYQMRPRDPREMISRFRKGDYPEDPYGHTNMESRQVQGLFLSSPLYRIPKLIPYQYLETTKAPNLIDGRFPKTKLVKEPNITGDKYWRYTFSHNDPEKGDIYEAIQVTELQSKYGFTWREIRDDWDKFFDIWGGELIVKELGADEILAIKRGYYFVNKFADKSGVCPKRKNQNITYDFVSKVLKPVVKKVAIPESYSVEEKENAN